MIVTILYAISAILSQYLAIHGTLVSAVWPPAGIALAAVLLFGNVSLIGIFLGCFIADFRLPVGDGILIYSILNAFVPGVGAAIEAYLGKLALQVLAGTYNIFNNTRSVLIFIFLSAFAACLINTTLGNLSLLLTGMLTLADFPNSWFTWWIADAVGVITFTPTIIAWSQKSLLKITFSEIITILITWLLIGIIGYIMLHSQVQVTYLFIPVAIWAAFQFEIRLSIITGLLISSICLYGSINGHGLFYPNSVDISISLIQIFISIIYLTILLINVILSDRQKAHDNLRLLNAQLEQRVQDRTKELTDINQELEVQKNKAINAFEALKHSHARLMQSEKMASLGVLTAGVAHEIKNPLNAISANIELIKKNMESIVQLFFTIQADEAVKNFVNTINENSSSLIAATNEGVKRTAGIIADLCAFSRDDEAEMTLTDLHQNIDSTLNLLNSEIKGNITVIKEYGAIPLLLCHPGKINQVIMNILVNAIHALQTQRDSKIIIKTESHDAAIILSIKDNGVGIKKEVRDKIFTPFFTTKQNGLGAGLGLFISYNIILEHEGTISVVSEPGQGTEFIITLPIKDAIH